MGQHVCFLLGSFIQGYERGTMGTNAPCAKVNRRRHMWIVSFTSHRLGDCKGPPPPTLQNNAPLLGSSEVENIQRTLSATPK